MKKKVTMQVKVNYPVYVEVDEDDLEIHKDSFMIEELVLDRTDSDIENGCSSSEIESIVLLVDNVNVFKTDDVSAAFIEYQRLVKENK